MATTASACRGGALFVLFLVHGFARSEVSLLHPLQLPPPLLVPPLVLLELPVEGLPVEARIIQGSLPIHQVLDAEVMRGHVEFP